MTSLCEPRADRLLQMNAFAYIFTAWVPIFTFPTYLQPYIVAGNYVTAGFGAAAAVTVLAIRYFHIRDLKGQHQQRATSPVDSESFGYKGQDEGARDRD